MTVAYNGINDIQIWKRKRTFR